MTDEGESQEETPEEAEEQVRRKSKPEKPRAPRKKEEKGVFSFYKIDGGLIRLRTFCERCGPGYFMADHKDRFTCGNCGFTRYKQSKNGRAED